MDFYIQLFWKCRQYWDEQSSRESARKSLLFECNTRALCKPRRVYLFRTEINILIGRSRSNQTEEHRLSSRFETKCLNAVPTAVWSTCRCIATALMEAAINDDQKALETLVVGCFGYSSSVWMKVEENNERSP